MAEQVVVDRRFRGPAESGNGGHACGTLTRFVDPHAAEVTLRLPPPVDRPLGVEAIDGGKVEMRVPGRHLHDADAGRGRECARPPRRPLHGRTDAGMTCVEMGWPIERDGRKLQAGSAIFG